MSNVLLVEDEYQLGEVIKSFFELDGLYVTHCEAAKDALQALDTRSFHCIILDLTLPDEDGLVLLRKIRGNNTIPVIICSARGSTEDRIAGLEFGADDYIAKPFSSQELLLRVKALIRRSVNEKKGELKIGHLYLNPDQKTLINKTSGESISMTITEFRLLKTLASHPGKVYSRAELIDAVSGLEGPENERAIDVAMSRLRKKIEHDPSTPEIICTAVGFGYYLDNRTLSL